jgi:putative FmdB family regulatory protein
MPIYEYECKKCGTFEHFQGMSEDPLKRCPECRSKVSRLISSSSFHLRGGGWYSDGYDSKSSKSKDKSSASGDAAGESSASSASKSSDKPSSASSGSDSSSSK